MQNIVVVNILAAILLYTNPLLREFPKVSLRGTERMRVVHIFLFIEHTL